MENQAVEKLNEKDVITSENAVLAILTPLIMMIASSIISFIFFPYMGELILAYNNPLFVSSSLGFRILYFIGLTGLITYVWIFFLMIVLKIRLFNIRMKVDKNSIKELILHEYKEKGLNGPYDTNLLSESIELRQKKLIKESKLNIGDYTLHLLITLPFGAIFPGWFSFSDFLGSYSWLGPIIGFFVFFIPLLLVTVAYTDRTKLE